MPYFLQHPEQAQTLQLMEMPHSDQKARMPCIQMQTHSPTVLRVSLGKSKIAAWMGQLPLSGPLLFFLLALHPGPAWHEWTSFAPHTSQCPILQGGASQTRLQPMLAFTPFVPQSHSQPFLIPSAQEAGLYSFNIQTPLPLASIWVRTVRGTAAYQVAGDGVGYLFLSPPAVPWPQFWQWLLSSRLLCL